MKNLKKLLQENNLTHYKFDEEKSRLVYHGDQTFVLLKDFEKLSNLLKKNNIKYTEIGPDIILIEQEV